ncbi:putative bifunctional diguanylate cyclase/phosphodiesterase [Azonexus hydrophilus]|uniref:putative bifunctional diguanylate cyclase/phosphodiesterase n=1 Tax=Azonexus hydrophilus TaxID=418702 RepID=UPI001FE0E1BD|nr:EAL domain-containing protein [Azonexus hydrophilus]
MRRVNAAFCRLTGYRPEEVIGKTPRVLASGRQGPGFYTRMWESLREHDTWEGEIWNRRKSGEIYPEWLIINVLRNDTGEVSGYVATFADISKLKHAESEVQHLAFYDPLTALPNRRLLLDRLEQARMSGKRKAEHGALLIIDVDNFKILNDTLGHDIGDHLLIEVACRLKACIRDCDTAARQGGDEFAVMIGALDPHPQMAAISAESIAEKLRLELARPVMLAQGQEYYCTASIGVTLFHGQDKTVDTLLKQADIALYKAKEAGRNAIRFFDQAMQTTLDRRARLEAGLRHALVRDEFVLHAQPLVDRDSGLVGAELLLRWLPDGQKLVPPDDFIPLAEESGLIVPIGLWVLDQACATLRRWDDDPRLRELYLAVNVSARQFRQPDFVDQVCAALARHGADPRRLKLELTESLLLDKVDEVVFKMRALRLLGVRFSLDDFGTGYASLSYLKKFPFDQLKVDRSFVRDIMSDPDDAAIIRAIIAMGRSLRLSVVAEGVETEGQYAYLIEHGCTLFQGYMFGRPQALSQFEAMLDGCSDAQIAMPDAVIGIEFG